MAVRQMAMSGAAGVVSGSESCELAFFWNTQRTKQVDRIDADAFCFDGDTFSDVYLSGQQRDWCSASFGEEVKQKDCTPYGASSGQLQTSHCSLCIRQFYFPISRISQMLSALCSLWSR